ncbi:uncharacterized protein LOC106013283 [Aplysia californica]|uniref:Uncharacterized protein LOC106013283 n=1 Tax=Aplysia californica TaxID=6500 RepID=A0ABM1AAJ3_APLCA|nr:uncharacterized protein LOC106013283 [Aplysia californica]
MSSTRKETSVGESDANTLSQVESRESIESTSMDEVRKSSHAERSFGEEVRDSSTSEKSFSRPGEERISTERIPSGESRTSTEEERLAVTQTKLSMTNDGRRAVDGHRKRSSKRHKKMSTEERNEELDQENRRFSSRQGSTFLLNDGEEFVEENRQKPPEMDVTPTVTGEVREVKHTRKPRAEDRASMLRETDFQSKNQKSPGKDHADYTSDEKQRVFVDKSQRSLSEEVLESNKPEDWRTSTYVDQQLSRNELKLSHADDNRKSIQFKSVSFNLDDGDRVVPPAPPVSRRTSTDAVMSSPGIVLPQNSLADMDPISEEISFFRRPDRSMIINHDGRSRIESICGFRRQPETRVRTNCSSQTLEIQNAKILTWEEAQEIMAGQMQDLLKSPRTVILGEQGTMTCQTSLSATPVSILKKAPETRSFRCRSPSPLLQRPNKPRHSISPGRKPVLERRPLVNSGNIEVSNLPDNVPGIFSSDTSMSNANPGDPTKTKEPDYEGSNVEASEKSPLGNKINLQSEGVTEGEELQDPYWEYFGDGEGYPEGDGEGYPEGDGEGYPEGDEDYYYYYPQDDSEEWANHYLEDPTAQGGMDSGQEGVFDLPVQNEIESLNPGQMDVVQPDTTPPSPAKVLLDDPEDSGVVRSSLSDPPKQASPELGSIDGGWRRSLDQTTPSVREFDVDPKPVASTQDQNIPRISIDGSSLKIEPTTAVERRSAVPSQVSLSTTKQTSSRNLPRESSVKDANLPALLEVPQEDREKPRIVIDRSRTNMSSTTKMDSQPVLPTVQSRSVSRKVSGASLSPSVKSPHASPRPSIHIPKRPRPVRNVLSVATPQNIQEAVDKSAPLNDIRDLLVSIREYLTSNGDEKSKQSREMNETANTILKELKRSREKKTDDGNAGNDPKTSDLVISYEDTQTVEVKVVFLRVADIDTISQQFEADVHIQARWQEKQFKGMTEKELDVVEFSQCWDPQLKILNILGGLDSEKATMILRYEPDYAYPVLTYMWQVKGLFREHLELEHFPLDVQELSIVLSSGRSVKDIELVQDFFHVSSLSPRALQDSQDWLPYYHVTFLRDVTTSESIGTTKHPVLVASCRARRRLGFYLWNVVIIVFLILGLSLTILAIDPTGNDRLGVTMTLFLTAVAFKLVVKTTLPPVSYLTYLDLYVVFTLIYLALQAAENAIMTHLAKFRDRDSVLFYDEVAQSVLIGLLMLFHAAFIVYIQLTAMARRREMAQKDYEHKMAQLRIRKSLQQKKTPQVSEEPPALPEE